MHCACISVTVIAVLPTCFNLSFVRRHSLMWNISQGCTTGTPAPMHGPPFATSVKIACRVSRLMASLVKVGNTHKYYTCLLLKTRMLMGWFLDEYTHCVVLCNTL